MVRAVFLILAFSMISDRSAVRFSFSEKPDLQWADFKGRPDAQSKYAASANTGISERFVVDFQGTLIKDSIVVTAYFYPKLSWYKPEFATKILLRHERGHFAISEIYARKLRMKIHDFRFSKHIHKQIDSLYQMFENERLLMQAQFDGETSHSRNGEREKQWWELIKRKLFELRGWASEK